MPQPPVPKIDPSQERRPDPDPTTLTQNAVDRGIEGLARVLDARFEGLRLLHDEQHKLLQEAIDAQRAYFTAILDEQRRGIEVAEEEREKAARALRVELARTIAEGDQNLRDHIMQQVQQIREALIAADKLEIARIDAVAQKLALITTHSNEAIKKAEEATEKRFVAVDNHVTQLAAEVGRALPREVAEATFAEYRRAIAEVTDKLSKVA